MCLWWYYVEASGSEPMQLPWNTWHKFKEREFITTLIIDYFDSVRHSLDGAASHFQQTDNIGDLTVNGCGRSPDIPRSAMFFS